MVEVEGRKTGTGLKHPAAATSVLLAIDSASSVTGKKRPLKVPTRSSPLWAMAIPHWRWHLQESQDKTSLSLLGVLYAFLFPGRKNRKYIIPPPTPIPVFLSLLSCLLPLSWNRKPNGLLNQLSSLEPPQLTTPFLTSIPHPINI